MLDDLVGDHACLDLARPANHLRDAESALPVGVLLVAERGHAPVGPAVHMGTVVRRVDDDGVVGDPELVEEVEDLADVAIVIDHRVVVLRLPPTRLADTLRLGVREGVHVSGVHPHEERCVRLVLPLDEVDRGLGDLVVDRLHPLGGQRSGVLDPLFAHLAEAPLLGRVVLVRGPGAHHAPGPGHLVESGELLRVGPIGSFRLLFGVEVVEVPEELVETVGGGEELVEVSQVVLAELPGGVSQRLRAARRSWDPPPTGRWGSRGCRPC